MSILLSKIANLKILRFCPFLLLILPNYYQSFFSGSSNLKPLNLEHHKKNPLETSGIGIGMGGIGIGGIGMSDLGFGGFALGGFGGIPPVYF